jgi:hypothetical protein
MLELHALKGAAQGWSETKQVVRRIQWVATAKPAGNEQAQNLTGSDDKAANARRGRRIYRTWLRIEVVTSKKRTTAETPPYLASTRRMPFIRAA